MEAWLSGILDNAFWTVLTGWVGVVPIEVWVIVGVVAVLVLLRFTGWPGVAVVVGIFTYILGVMRGRNMARPSPKREAAPVTAKPKRKTLLGEILRGLDG